MTHSQRITRPSDGRRKMKSAPWTFTEPDPDNEHAHIGGRSPSLVQARNRHLLCRFLYWHENPEVKYEWVVEQLSREFYISQSTIGQILAANIEQLRILRKQKSLTRWKKEYEFVRW